jgi:hypothetical protein
VDVRISASQSLLYRKLEIVLEEPEQSLPRTAELQNFVED